MISFLTNSNLTYELYRGRKDNPKFCGGNYYEIEAINTLESSYKLKFENLALRKKMNQFLNILKDCHNFVHLAALSLNHQWLLLFQKIIKIL